MTTTQCILCSTPLAGREDERGAYCCAGCERVHDVLGKLDETAGVEYLAAARRLGLVPGGDEPQEPKARELPSDPAAIREERFAFSGLSCPSCSWVIEQVLVSTSGVQSAKVDYFSGTGLLTYDMRVTSEDRILSLLRPLGYELESLAGERRKLFSRRATYSFVIAAIITMNLMSLSVVRYIERLGWIDGAPQMLSWLELFLVLPVLWIGWIPMARRAIAGVRRGQLTMDFLIAVAVLAAFGLSLSALLLGRSDIYFETCAGLTTIALLSRMIEARLRDRAFADLATLMSMRVVHARRITTSCEEEFVDLEQIAKGDVVLINFGETVPFDGMVAGQSVWVSEAVLTGEPMPIEKVPGDRVVAGSEITEGVLKLQVERPYTETRLFQIAASLADSLQKAEGRLRAADRIAGIFSPGVLVLSLTVWVIRLIAYGMDYAFSADGLFPSIAILAVACPCAFSIAGVSAITAATGALLKRGFLVKEPSQLEDLATVDHVVFDKTGTVTEGQMTVADLVWSGEQDPLLMRMVAKAEEGATHPVAVAIRHFLAQHNVEMGDAGEVEDVPGQGRILRAGESRIRVGSASMFEELFETDRLNSTHTAVWIGRTQKALGVFLITDFIKEDAARAVSELTSMGLGTSLISGDRQEVTAKVGDEIGVGLSVGGVTLDQKVELVQEMVEQKRSVAFVGDGTNDALAMGASTVSIALARSTDEALTASGLVALRGNLEGLPGLFRMGQELKKIIRTNYIWAFSFNIFFIPIAAAGKLVPLVAMLLMLVSSTAVLLNSLRIRRL